MFIASAFVVLSSSRGGDQATYLSPISQPIGLVVKASTLIAVDLWFDSCLCCGDFSRSSHASDLEIGTPVATLPGAWRYRVSGGTGRPGVSIL